MAFCSACGTQIPDGATICPACSGAVGPGRAITQSGTGGVTDNVAGMLAYFTIIPAIVFLVLEPYNRNRFIRFHSFQSIFFAVAWTVIWIALGIFAHIPFLGWASVVIW